MKKLVALLCSIPLLIGSLAVSASEPIKLQTESFPPYNFSPEGKNFAKGENVAGISADIVKEMFQRANLSMSMTLRFPWKRVYSMALDKPNYGVFSMVRSPERENLFQWVGPLAVDEWVLFAKADSSIKVSALHEVKQYVVGGYKGDALTSHLSDQGIDVVASSQDKHNIKKLLNGTIDLWASNSYSARVLAKQNGVSFSAFKPVFSVDKVNLYLGLNKSVEPSSVQALQRALNDMRSEGRTERIIDSYIQ